ncbi:MAG: cellulase family glycosylhydrolase [Flavobacteriales bacterium]|nr:cellulase family glycosylhydrolase [Flavobacteriales bacterium]MEB2340530.1 cellulase family glycosylhydrolase [Flavobacteriia bacterium]
MADGHMELDGKPFFPIALNYIADLQWNDTACWAAPCRNYERADLFRFSTRDSTLKLIEAEFRLIRQLGFNTVRIVGIASDLVELGPDEPVYLQARYGSGVDSLFALSREHEDRYLQAMDELLQVAERTGLKVILLVRLRVDQPRFVEQCLLLADRFRDRPVIMAYDLFNEPLYFDRPHHRPKDEVHRIVKHWRGLMRKHAPDQLTTIGLAGLPEVFSWDPNILDVDFISFHPYEYEPEQVRNEIHWYGEYVKKPWMIGETAIPADNDSVPYSTQLAFARKTVAQTLACGGIGYSWWQFKDVAWQRFHPSYMGVMDRKGWTEVDPALPPLEGTVKPVAKAFQEFDLTARKGHCEALPNYYNYSSFHTAKIYGRLVDRDRKPVPGGAVYGWNEDWSVPWYTIAKEDGTFELHGNFRYHHWMASATRYSMVRGDCQPGAYVTGSDGTASYYLGEIVLERLHLDEDGN